MAERGLSEEGLERLHDTMVGHVDRGAMPGLITLVARDGRVHVDVIGSPSFDDPRPLARDAIFRIASLTKPITAAAAMALVEDRVMAMDNPVAEWLPELAEPRVLQPRVGARRHGACRAGHHRRGPLDLPVGLRSGHGPAG